MSDCPLCKEPITLDDTKQVAHALVGGCDKCVRHINQHYDDSETIARCSSCGYQVTDLEKSAYQMEGQYQCVFCSGQSVWLSRRQNFFENIQWIFSFKKKVELQIFELKVDIRNLIYLSPKARRLRARRDVLEIDFHDMIYNQPYKQDERGFPVLNAHQIELDRVKLELEELQLIARLVYYDELGKFGSHSDDEAPATRKLNLKQKLALAKALKARLKTLQTYKENGFYD